jgi:hypothetical protein
MSRTKYGIRLCGVRRRRWKYLSRNHENYSQRKSTIIGIPQRGEVLAALPVIMDISVTILQDIIRSPTLHFRQYVVVHFFTIFLVSRMLLSANTRYGRWDFPSSLPYVSGILHKVIFSCQSANWTASLTVYSNFSTGTSGQTFGNFLVEYFQRNFSSLFDVCIYICQVKQMKEKWLPSFYRLLCG